MKRYLYLIYIFFSFILFTNNLKSNIQSSIIVKVDTKIITSFEVKNKILSTLIISENEISQENIDSLKRQTLNNLILYKLKEIELERFNFKVNEQRLNSTIKRIAKNDVERLKNNFENYNLDFNLWKKEIETELKWKQFIFFQYSKKIEIDEKTIDKEVKKIIESSSNNMEANLSEIEIFQDEKVKNEVLIAKYSQR